MFVLGGFILRLKETMIKLGISYDGSNEMRDSVYRYVEGLQ